MTYDCRQQVLIQDYAVYRLGTPRKGENASGNTLGKLLQDAIHLLN